MDLCRAKVYTFCRNKCYSDVPERLRKCWIKKKEMRQEPWQPRQSCCLSAEHSPTPSGAQQQPAPDSALPCPLGKCTFIQQSKENLLRGLQRAGLWYGGPSWPSLRYWNVGLPRHLWRYMCIAVVGLVLGTQVISIQCVTLPTKDERTQLLYKSSMC